MPQLDNGSPYSLAAGIPITLTQPGQGGYPNQTPSPWVVLQNNSTFTLFWSYSTQSGAIQPGGSDLIIIGTSGIKKVLVTPMQAGQGTMTVFWSNDGDPVPVGYPTSAINTTAPSSLVVTTTALPAGEVGVGYIATLTAAGGSPPYTWSILSGDLPDGLSLSGAVISGTPTTVGAFSFEVEVTDSLSNTNTQPLAITITGSGPIGGNDVIAQTYQNAFTSATTVVAALESAPGTADTVLVAIYTAETINSISGLGATWTSLGSAGDVYVYQGTGCDGSSTSITIVQSSSYAANVFVVDCVKSLTAGSAITNSGSGVTLALTVTVPAGGVVFGGAMGSGYISCEGLPSLVVETNSTGTVGINQPGAANVYTFESSSTVTHAILVPFTA